MPRLRKEKVNRGFCVIAGMMVCAWVGDEPSLLLVLPLLLFSSSSPVLVQNPVQSSNLYLDIIVIVDARAEA